MRAALGRGIGDKIKFLILIMFFFSMYGMLGWMRVRVRHRLLWSKARLESLDRKWEKLCSEKTNCMKGILETLNT